MKDGLERAKADERRWSDWMASAQRGDREAYASLMKELGFVIEGYLRLRFGSPSFVEDCVQDTLLAIHRASASWDPHRPFRPWLFAIVRHKAVDALRAKSRGGVGEAAELTEAAVANSQENPQSRSSRDPARRIDGARLLESLSSQHREALVMTKFHGYSIEEAAGFAGVSQTAMKTRVSRGIRAIKRLIEDENAMVLESGAEIGQGTERRVPPVARSVSSDAEVTR